MYQDRDIIIVLQINVALNNTKQMSNINNQFLFGKEKTFFIFDGQLFYRFTTVSICWIPDVAIFQSRKGSGISIRAVHFINLHLAWS